MFVSCVPGTPVMFVSYMGHPVSDQPIFCKICETPLPISMEFGTLAGCALKKYVQIFSDVGQAVSEISPSKKWKRVDF